MFHKIMSSSLFKQNRGESIVHGGSHHFFRQIIIKVH